MWQPNERYPDPAVRVLDKEFLKYRLPLASVERLHTGCRWSEGPVYVGDGRYVLWSDIPNNRVLRWDEESGNVTIFRKPSNNANGHTRDRRGRLIACEHDARRLVRFEYDGAITVLADRYNGKPLNSPNDVVVKSDGSIWFTDPIFGILGYYEGHKEESQNKPAVYRVDGKTGKITMVLDDLPGPNGLAFSPDEKKLYVVASRDARVSPLFNRVTENVSDLSSASWQLSATLMPINFNSNFSWTASYVYTNVRERARGFGANTAGNPLAFEWSRSNFDSRHQLQYSFFYNAWDWVRVNWNGSFRSGTPFTPLAGADLNGDGAFNDRAFVFDGAGGGDATLGAAMTSLMNSAPSYVQSCLRKQVGTVAGRNSCEGPWTATANLSVSFNPVKLRLPQREAVRHPRHVIGGAPPRRVIAHRPAGDRVGMRLVVPEQRDDDATAGKPDVDEKREGDDDDQGQRSFKRRSDPRRADGRMQSLGYGTRRC